MKSINSLPPPAAGLRPAISTVVEPGHDHASMDGVARAGPAKRTVHARLGSKDALCRAAVTRVTGPFLDTRPAPRDLDHPQAALTAISGRSCEASTSMGATRLSRTAMAVADQVPDVGRMLRRTVIQPAEAMLAEDLGERARARNRPAVLDAALATARLLLNMISRPPRHALLFQPRDPAPWFPASGSLPGTDRAAIRLVTPIFPAGSDAI